MKFFILRFILFLWISSVFPVYAQQGGGNSVEAVLKNVDAIQAMAIANQWKWSHREVKSYVTPREVVFKFSNGKVVKIPLPEDKIMVAVAPYINRTHK